ncbi:MAG: hypothetical protein D6736_19570 [Nitrospinota bacterium]|nr:MAG: hypothetical protein D6736_19570 [Nitrospinota bacterium]
MDNWVASSLLALVCFGLWGFFPKLATHYLTPQSAIIYEIAGVMLAGIPTLYLVGRKLEETITLKQGIGIVLALVALLLFTT